MRVNWPMGWNGSGVWARESVRILVFVDLVLLFTNEYNASRADASKAQNFNL